METPATPTSPWGAVVVGPRPGPMRDRRGRGRRGVVALPGPLSPRGIPTRSTPSAAFDHLVAQVLGALAPAFGAETRAVEVVVEDAPMLPAAWDEPVPTSIVNQTASTTRIVLYRLPITRRAHDPEVIEDLTWSVLLQRLGEIWQVDPDDLDPRG